MMSSLNQAGAVLGRLPRAASLVPGRGGGLGDIGWVALCRARCRVCWLGAGRLAPGMGTVASPCPFKRSGAGRGA